MTKVLEGECVPAVNSRNGKILKKRRAMGKTREILEEREGPPPFPKALCRHLCKNDSTSPNGFVCTLHTTWGTAYENKMDQSPENRAAGGRIGGKIGGKISGKIVAPIINARPDHPNKVEVTCPHCGKVGAKMIMARWHFDNCKSKSKDVLLSPEHQT